MPIARLDPLSGDEGPLVTFASTCGEEKKIPGGPGGRGGELFKCMHAHSHVTSRPLFKVMNNAFTY